MCKPYASKLPPKWRVEEVAVGGAAVISRSSYRRTSQDHLAHHELTVIFPDGALFLFEARIWQIGTLSPFPSFPPSEPSGCGLPFPLGGQSAPLPGGICHGFVIADMTNRLVFIQQPQTSQRILVPLTFNKMPVQRGGDGTGLHPIPAFRMPVDKILIPAGLYKCKVFLIGDKVSRDLEIIQIYLMPGQLVVKTKFISLITYLIESGRDGEKMAAVGAPG